MMRVRDLPGDESGATIIEFALVSPMLVLLLLGVFDLGHGIYTKTMLMGSIEKASRDSTIESASTGALDTKVSAAVHQIAPGATVTFSRSHYTSFTQVRKSEDFTDTNHDTTCDNGEPFEDANGNGRWDIDQGLVGQGSARDAVLYKVTVTYPRLFPLWKLLRQSSTSQLVASTVLRNQPYTLQALPAKQGNC